MKCLDFTSLCLYVVKLFRITSDTWWWLDTVFIEKLSFYKAVGQGKRLSLFLDSTWEPLLLYCGRSWSWHIYSTINTIINVFRRLEKLQFCLWVIQCSSPFIGSNCWYSLSFLKYDHGGSQIIIIVSAESLFWLGFDFVPEISLSEDQLLTSILTILFPDNETCHFADCALFLSNRRRPTNEFVPITI